MRAKKVLAIAATGLFGVGKIFSTSGQFVFILENGFTYFNIKNRGLIISTATIGGLSTAYIRGITRFPALWQLFTGQTQEGIPIWEGTTNWEKCNVIVMGSINTLAAIADGIQAYLGSNTMLEVFGLQIEGAAQTPLVISINSILALSCTFSYLAFFSKKSLQNALRLQREIRNSQLSDLTERNTLIGIGKTVFSCSFAGISYVAFIYYSGSVSLNLIWPSISEATVISTCSIVGASIMITFLTSRCGEAYRYFVSNQPNITQVYRNSLTTFKDKAIVVPHWVIGFVDIVVFMLASYFSFLGMFSFFGVNLNLLTKLLPILPCLSVGFLHYVFSLRPAIKTCIENRESYEPPIVLPVNEQPTQGEQLPLIQQQTVTHSRRNWSINCCSSFFDEADENDTIAVLRHSEELSTLPRYGISNSENE